MALCNHVLDDGPCEQTVQLTARFRERRCGGEIDHWSIKLPIWLKDNVGRRLKIDFRKSSCRLGEYVLEECFFRRHGSAVADKARYRRAIRDSRRPGRQ